MSEHPIQFRQAAGTLTVFIFVGEQAKPVKGVKVTITNTEGVIIANDQTDDSGQTNSFSLTTPEKSLSLASANDLPYSKYNIKAEADGYEIVVIKDVQVFPDTMQEIKLTPVSRHGYRQFEEYFITEHALVDKEPKLSEETIKEIAPQKFKDN